MAKDYAKQGREKGLSESSRHKRKLLMPRPRAPMKMRNTESPGSLTSLKKKQKKQTSLRKNSRGRPRATVLELRRELHTEGQKPEGKGQPIKLKK